MIRTRNKHPIYPLLAIVSSILIFAGSMILAKREGYFFLGVITILLLAFGMWRELLRILPFAIVLSGIYFGIAYAISGGVEEGLYGVVRVTGFCLAIVPGISVPVVNLSRSLNQLHAPRAVSVGILITMRFFPLLGQEIRTIRQAMKTRGVSPSPASFYRSTILPFCLKLVNISDLLALSLETRAFGLNKKATSYKKVSIGAIDIAYSLLVIAAFTCGLIFLPITRTGA